MGGQLGDFRAWQKALLARIFGGHRGGPAGAPADRPEPFYPNRAFRRAHGYRTPAFRRANSWSRNHRAVPASLRTHHALRGVDGRLVRVPGAR
jgi:hypothetical protein